MMFDPFPGIRMRSEYAVAVIWWEMSEIAPTETCLSQGKKSTAVEGQRRGAM